MSKKFIASLIASSMFFTPLAEAKFGRSFVRMGPRPVSVKPPTTQPTVASKPATTLVQTPTTTQPTSASTIANTTSTSVPVQPVTTLPATSNISASPTYSIAPAAPAAGPAAPVAPVANAAVTAAKPVLPAPLTVASPVYSSRPSTTKTPESSTMQNIVVGVLGGLGIAMLADSLFGDDNSSSASQSPTTTDNTDASSSTNSFSSLLFTAGLVVLFLGLVWFTVSEFIRYRRRTAR